MFVFVSKTWLYSSAVMMPVECFFRRPCALWGERAVRKYWARSVWGVECGDGGVSVDVVEVFVEVDSVGCVPDGGGECKHEVRDCTCPRVQNPKSAGVEAELCNEEDVMGEGGDSDGVGDELGNDVVCSQCGSHSSRSNRVGVRPFRSGRERHSPGGGVSSG